MMYTGESPIRQQDTQVALGLLPLSHIYGLVAIAHVAQYRGDELIVLQRFQLDQLLGAIEKFHIEELYVVPPIIVQILSNADKCQKYNLSCVRVVLSGAAPLGGETIQKLLELYPKWKIGQGYGTFTSTVSLKTTKLTKHLRFDRGYPGSVFHKRGRHIPWVIRLFDPRRKGKDHRPARR
jgi:acyl-CoA synthetase (AMP-forming)/AMP-acid ligase II